MAQLPVLRSGQESKSRSDVAASPQAGIAALESAALIFGETAPHAGILTGFEGPAQAFVDDAAATADNLGFLDLHQRRAGVTDREEQLRVFVTAGTLVAPVHADHSIRRGHRGHRHS